MTAHTTADHRMMRESRWIHDEEAERVSDRILTSHGVTDSHLVSTSAGDVVINTGFASHGARHRERYEQLLGRPLDVRALVFTQAYYEQIGGWEAFADPGVEVLAHRHHGETIHDQEVVHAIHGRRAMRVLARLIPPAGGGVRLMADAPPPVTTFVDDAHRFTVGDRRFELLSVRGGEAMDCLAVWVPEERAVFTGNLVGALHGALPNLYTLRGARLRSAWRFLEGMERVRDLDAEIHVPGHGPVITGAAHVRDELQKVIDAVRYLHDRTVEGMNAGVDLWTLVREVRLPADMQLQPGRCPEHWIVRSVWEDYLGWARMESTTELYGVAPQSVWGELVELAGGPDALVERAERHLAGGAPLQAIHFTDMVLSVDPRHLAALAAHLRAHEALLEAASDSFDELGYLESEITRTQARIERAGGSAS
jgi:glyoxylase-like metal-dependent hydrolase (beta-lactamase superfamily II)